MGAGRPPSMLAAGAMLVTSRNVAESSLGRDLRYNNAGDPSRLGRSRHGTASKAGGSAFDDRHAGIAARNTARRGLALGRLPAAAGATAAVARGDTGRGRGPGVRPAAP